MLIRLLRRYLAPYRRQIGALAGLQLVQALAALYLPTLNAAIVDTGVLRGDTGYILRAGAVMLAVTAVQVASTAGAVFLAARTAMAAGRDLRADIFGQVLRLSARDVGRFGAPSLITRTTNDVQQVQMLTLLTFTLLLPAPVICLGGVLLAVRLDLPLSALLLVIVPVLVVLVLVLMRRLQPLYLVMQERIDTVNRVLREQIMGTRVIRAFVRDRRERARFAAASADLMGSGVGTGKLMAMISPAVMIVINVSCVAVLWFGGHRVADGMPVGDLIAFLSYLMQILIAAMMATFMLATAPRAQASAGRITEVLAARSSLAPPDAPAATLPRSGRLELREVSFRYPGAEDDVLNGITMAAGPGTLTAIVGGTGAGKTTLLGLIPRLADVTGGTVLVDGADVRTVDPALLCRTVALVPQRAYLFSGTVATNLRFARPDAADSELWHALEVAQAADFVRAMPGGLDAPIGPGGGNISGGQRQRLAIARALVARPQIYLFDDVFAALDYRTEAALRAALSSELGRATVLLVSQRVAAITAADQIVVLDGGRVVAHGSHQELLTASETYRQLVLSQPTAERAVA
ncbi:MAG TPA: ABC transporter ATP-binding protein [Streptosporangiaceae bacterium]|jgi:ATP-binding cassette subfamily B protein